MLGRIEVPGSSLSLPSFEGKFSIGDRIRSHKSVQTKLDLWLMFLPFQMIGVGVGYLDIMHGRGGRFLSLLLSPHIVENFKAASLIQVKKQRKRSM